MKISMTGTRPGNNSSGSNAEMLREVLGMIRDGIAAKQATTQETAKDSGTELDAANSTKPTASAVNTATTGKPNTSDTKNSGFSYEDFSYRDYAESDVVRDAENVLSAHLSAKPGEYESQWQAQLDDIIDKILNREAFSYDFNGDALYQQYKDKYIQQGKMAMQDTMGQAAAMTGGYGNSYAATVGNQAYQSQLQELNDVIPELYQMAFDRYNQEGQDLYNLYAMLGERESLDYGKYRDSVADWESERNYLASRLDSEKDREYAHYTDSRNFDYGVHSDEKSYAYNEYRNAIADQQWQAEFDEGVRQYDASLAEEQRQYDASVEYAAAADKLAQEQWQAEFDEMKRQFDAEMEYRQSSQDVAEVSDLTSISDLRSARELISEMAVNATSVEDYNRIIGYINTMAENGLSESAVDALVNEYIPDDILDKIYGSGSGITIDDLYEPDKQAIMGMNDLINKMASGEPLTPDERSRYNAMMAMVGA